MCVPQAVYLCTNASFLCMLSLYHTFIFTERRSYENGLKLITIDADTLMSTSLPPLRVVIDRLLPQGVNVLAGSSKIGKSWLALWLCLQVAKGESVWGLATHGGTVLYLCLEDNFTRIQNRLFQITDDAPETLHFATIAAGLYSGLQEQLTNFLAQHPDTSLVVIDTFLRIRDENDTGVPYASDYRDVTVLKAIADKHNAGYLYSRLRQEQESRQRGAAGDAGDMTQRLLPCRISQRQQTPYLLPNPPSANKSEDWSQNWDIRCLTGKRKKSLLPGHQSIRYITQPSRVLLFFYCLLILYILDGSLNIPEGAEPVTACARNASTASPVLRGMKQVWPVSSAAICRISSSVSTKSKISRFSFIR